MIKISAIRHHVIKVKELFQTYTFSLFFVSTIVTSLIAIARSVGGLQTLELLAYDWMVNLHSKKQTDPRLLVVEVTDRDIEQQNEWPLSDATIAELLTKLQPHQPRAIGLDLYRDIAHPPGHEALTKQLQADNLIAIKFIGSGHNRISAPPEIPPHRIGFNDVVVDVDDVVRRNLMYVRVDEQEMYSFALRLSLKYLQEQNLDFKVEQELLKIGDTVFPRLHPDSGGYQMQPSEALGWQTLINYRSPQIAETITLGEVLAGEFDSGLVKDRIVIIGASAPSIKDVLFTPYRGAQTLMPGVMVHAQMVSQILTTVLDQSPLFWFWDWWLESLWIWGWSLIGASIAWKLKHPLSIGISVMIGLGGLWGIGWLAHTQAGWIPIIPPALNFALVCSGVLGYKVLYTMFYDPLTGLPNRNLFAKKLKKLQDKHKHQSDRAIAIFCLDLDRFKTINDGLGYAAGDRLLLSTTQRLKNHLGVGVDLARVGADEFAIALLTSEDISEAIAIANKLERELAIPFTLESQNIFTSVSIGLALHPVNEDFQPSESIRAAHTAMYQAKASGKAQHQVFATKMHEQARKRLQLEADLHAAIKNQEFALYYQPIINLNTGAIAGFEALVRWISPQRGFISPGAFIPVAEETGLIIPMGQWILATACTQMRSWQQQLPDLDSVVMSVNLSSRQFSQPDLVEQIQKVLITTDLDPKNLKLEITESMVIDDVEKTIILLDRLKNLGIKMSMDDFGTGFSSFSYLHRFPMDTLKVDRSFVSNMNKGVKNQEIVSTIVMLAHKLGMDVVAEGIETESEQQILQGLNCEYGQGYYFAKPLPVADATQLLIDKTTF